MGKADAWQWWFDFPTKLLDVPLRGEKETLLFDFMLVLIRNLVLPHPQTQPRARLPNGGQKSVFYACFKNRLKAEGCLSPSA